MKFTVEIKTAAAKSKTNSVTLLTQGKACFSRLSQLCVLILAGFLLSNCTPGLMTQAPATVSAKELLSASSFMKKTISTTLVLFENKVFLEKDLIAEHPEIKPYLAKGWVTTKPNTVALGQDIGAVFRLTPEGESEAASSEWKSTTGPAGEKAWLIVTARKAWVHGTVPVITGNRAICDFQWKWIPTTVGKAIGGIDETPKTSSAEFFLDTGGQWRLKEESVQ